MTYLKGDMTKKCSVRACPECKSTRLVERMDENCTVCLDCGFVISAETAKLISERKAKINQYDHVRPNSCSVKPASRIEDKEPGEESIVHALEQWKQVRIWDSTEKNLALALQYITKIAIDLSLPNSALEKATLAYKRIIEKGLLKGRSMRAISATAIYIGCKQSNTAITINDIARASKTKPKKICHSYRSIIKRLEFPIQTTSVSNHAFELSHRLKLSARTMIVLEKIIKVLDSYKGFVGKAPTGVACAAIYMSSLLADEKRPQREIAETARITEATIRSRCREIEKNLVFIVHL